MNEAQRVELMANLDNAYAGSETAAGKHAGLVMIEKSEGITVTVHRTAFMYDIEGEAIEEAEAIIERVKAGKPTHGENIVGDDLVDVVDDSDADGNLDNIQDRVEPGMKIVDVASCENCDELVTFPDHCGDCPNYEEEDETPDPKDKGK